MSYPYNTKKLSELGHETMSQYSKTTSLSIPQGLINLHCFVHDGNGCFYDSNIIIDGVAKPVARLESGLFF